MHRFNFVFLKALILLASFADGQQAIAEGTQSGVNAPNGEQSVAKSACQGDLPTFDPSLSPEFLRVATRETGNPRLIIGHFSQAQGLLAGYQSDAGVRILFRFLISPEGKMKAPEVLIFDEKSQRVVFMAGQSPSRDPETGTLSKDFIVAGVELLALKKAFESSRDADSPDVEKIKRFAASEEGRAFLEAVPALYASLEPFELVPAAPNFKLPFGLIVTTLQLVTKQFAGFKHADKVLGVARANQFRDACREIECEFSGKAFTVRRAGFFDILSKAKRRVVEQNPPCL